MHYIYLHGFTSGPASFKAHYFFRRLAELGITLHIPDLNDGDFEGLTLSRQLDQVATLCTSLPGPLTLIGSSLGGYIGALYAEREPRVERLVLMAPAFRFVTRHFEQMPAERIETWQRERVISVYHHLYQEERALGYGLIEDARHYDNTTLTRQIPALLFHGHGDESVPCQLSEAYLKENREARLHLLDDDHGLARSLEFMWAETVTFLGLGSDMASAPS